MVKKLLLSGGVLLALAIAVFSTLVYTSVGVGRPIEPRYSTGRVTQIADGFVACFLLDAGPGSVALVDACEDQGAEALLAELKRRGLGPDAVKAIFLTHGHADHTGGAALFPAAVVYAHPLDAALAEGRAGSRALLTRWRSPAPGRVRVTRPLADGDRIRIGELDVRAFHVPGHTDGSMALLVDGALLLGDNAVATRSGALAPAPRFFTDDPGLNRQSLAALSRKVSGLGVRTLLFAHSGHLEGTGALERFARELAPERP